jgi:hypothetical protein
VPTRSALDPPSNVIIRRDGIAYLVPGWLTPIATVKAETLAAAEQATRDVGIFMSQWVRVR